jgi:phage repressor protein C with HTH and peptisase S24 domain
MTELEDDSGNDLPTYDLGVADRIGEVIGQLGQDKSVQVTGRSWKTLSRYMAGKEAPFTVVASLASAAGRSMSWMATGGDDQRTPDGFRLIRRLDTEASAGAGAVVEAEPADTLEVLAFREDWLRRRGINPLTTHALTARGDSMEPTIRDGDVLLVDTSIDFVRDNAIYVVVFAGRTLVKRLQVLRDGSVAIKSDNKDVFDDEVVPAAEVPGIDVAGRVMWYGRSI